MKTFTKLAVALGVLMGSIGFEASAQGKTPPPPPGPATHQTAPGKPAPKPGNNNHGRDAYNHRPAGPQRGRIASPPPPPPHICRACHHQAHPYNVPCNNLFHHLFHRG